jgi:hypothetical protein
MSPVPLYLMLFRSIFKFFTLLGVLLYVVSTKYGGEKKWHGSYKYRLQSDCRIFGLELANMLNSVTF